MDLDDFIDLDDVTRSEVRDLIDEHNADWQEFLEEVGLKPLYTGEEVVTFLGY